MNVTYSWSFNPLECAPSEDGLEKVVKNVHWRLTGVANGAMTDVYGVVAFDSPEANSFITFDSLTANTVETWVKSKLDVPALRTSIETALAEKMQPKSVTLTPPWLKVNP
jgi:hypothetical protein